VKENALPMLLEQRWLYEEDTEPKIRAIPNWKEC